MRAADILAALGVSDQNAALLCLAEEEARADILRRCRLYDLPADMAPVLARFSAGKYLTMAMQTGALRIGGEEPDHVASIKEGDTQVSFSTAESGASRIRALADTLTDGAQLSRWRRLDWPDAEGDGGDDE